MHNERKTLLVQISSDDGDTKIRANLDYQSLIILHFILLKYNDVPVCAVLVFHPQCIIFGNALR